MYGTELQQRRNRRGGIDSTRKRRVVPAGDKVAYGMGEETQAFRQEFWIHLVILVLAHL